MSTATYDPKSVLVSFKGVPLSGFMDGTFVEVAYDEDAWMKKVGADGEPARAKNRNKGGTVTVTLLQTSAANDLLSAFYNQDQLLNTGSGPIMVKDALGTTLVLARDAWVKKLPDVVQGKEIAERVWVFDTGELEVYVGGN